VGMVSYQYDGATLFTAPVYASRAVAAVGGDASAQPSTSPLAIASSPPDGASDGNNSYVFWICLVIVLVLIVGIARLVAIRRRRRRAPRRRKAYRARIVK